MKTNFENGVLTVTMDRRLDVYTAPETERVLLEAVDSRRPETVILDCTAMEYIASAGLRVLLKVGKAVPRLRLINVIREVYEILDITGFTDAFEVRRLMREISVEGCPIIGAGFSSDVYRIDRETVVKLFAERVTLDRIYGETASAKKSFVAGIPTAIPYDVVKCGNRYGTVFELIDADTLSQNFMDHPEKFDSLMERYVELLKLFHATPAGDNGFPDIHDKYHAWAAGLKKYMSDDEVAQIDRLIDAIPSRQTLIHVDCHSRNIMVQDDKLIFVDMADVSVGHPFVDIGSEYFHYMIFRTTSLGAKVIFGVEPEDAELPVRVWDELVRRYFDRADPAQMEEIRTALRYFGCLRCLIMVAKHAHIEREQAMELIDRQRRDLLQHVDEAEALFARADEFFSVG